MLEKKRLKWVPISSTTFLKIDFLILINSYLFIIFIEKFFYIFNNLNKHWKKKYKMYRKSVTVILQNYLFLE